MNSEHQARLFTLNNFAIETSIRKVSEELDLNLGPSHLEQEKDEDFYPQFSVEARKAAAEMARHYEIFYCLETSIRELVADRLREEKGQDWWNTDVVPNEIRKTANKNRNKEKETGVSYRSEDMLAYINFGELGEIIKFNWEVFQDQFRDIKAVEKVMSNLNGLRAPIAHCGVLERDEILRLKLSVGDWFRIME